MKLTEKDMGCQNILGLGDELFIRLKDKRKYTELKQQILSNQEKAEKLDKYENEDWIAIERKVWKLERQENKRLKEELEIATQQLSGEQYHNGHLNVEVKQLKKQWSDLVDPWLNEKGELKDGIVDEIKRNKEIVERIRDLNNSDCDIDLFFLELKELLSTKATKEENWMDNNQTVSCPECGWDGGKYGHTKQTNPQNPYDLICSSCSFAWITKRRTRNAE